MAAGTAGLLKRYAASQRVAAAAEEESRWVEHTYPALESRDSKPFRAIPLPEVQVVSPSAYASPLHRGLPSPSPSTPAANAGSLAGIGPDADSGGAVVEADGGVGRASSRAVVIFGATGLEPPTPRGADTLDEEQGFRGDVQDLAVFGTGRTPPRNSNVEEGISQALSPL